ncbi:MAG: LysE family translocator [Bacteroidetes bacterium]|nr:LysE family translocator [Bacteroidota bacterium]
MSSALLEGVGAGILLAFLIGPSFFALIQTSIYRGFNSGIQLALGIVLSDITLIGLSYLGALQILSNDKHKYVVGIAGGVVLIIFGIITFLRKYKIPTSSKIEIRVKTDKAFKYILKGFFINILNPFLIIFWLAVITGISAKYQIHSKETIIFFVGVIVTVFLTDAFKCFIAHKIKKYLNLKVIILINRIVGVLLIIFGIFMFVRLFYDF